MQPVYWEAKEVSGLWVTALIDYLTARVDPPDLEAEVGASFSMLRYCVIDDVMSPGLTLVASAWPKVLPSGQLSFGDSRCDATFGLRLGDFERFLEERKPQRPFRAVRLGDVFAMSSRGLSQLARISDVEREEGDCDSLFPDTAEDQPGTYAVVDATPSARLAARVSARRIVTHPKELDKRGSISGRYVDQLQSWLAGAEEESPEGEDDARTFFRSDSFRPVQWRHARPEPRGTDDEVGRSDWEALLEQSNALMAQLRTEFSDADGIDWRLAFPSSAQEEIDDEHGLLQMLGELRVVPVES